MKTKILSLAVVLLVSQTMMAQFHIGVKAGANITKVDGESFKKEFRYGYHLGAFAEIGLGNKFILQPEVLFNQYSTTLDSNYKHIYENVFNPSYQANTKLNYLSIPIVLNYKLLGPIYLQAGPQFGVLIDQNKTLLQNGGQAFRNGDFAMLGGVQLKLANVRITGRYSIGLSNINDIDNQDKWKNQAIQVSLGLAF
ncbi:MAG TPA: porin family protein [Chitinophagaceae bacterium]|nr:porin family protein [Chitinophagaceae bacterium]